MKNLLLLLFLTVTIINLQAQKYTVSGYIFDSSSKEKLIGANVFDISSQKGTLSNNFGFYSISFKKSDTLKLQISYIGYLSSKKNIFVNKDTSINFSMQKGIELDELTVSADRQNQSGNIKISMEQVETLPSLTGEKDVLKVYTLMPGVQSGNEASSELYVRGGSPDQNLILIDDVPVYYVNHLGGFISIFDENAVNSINLIKGGFPARYGGRLSSVIDVRLKNGDMKKFSGEISAGLISSRLFIQGPLKKDKTSFILSARRCNIDIVSRVIMLFAEEGFTTGYTFYDVNAKINHKINENNQISLTVYTGRDRLFAKDKEKEAVNYMEGSVKYIYSSKLSNKWGNTIAALKWKRKWSAKLFGNVTFAYTLFHSSIEDKFTQKAENKSIMLDFKDKFKSNVNDFILKTDYDYYLNSNHSVKFGISGIYHSFNPGKIEYYLKAEDSETIDTSWCNKKIYAPEIYAYIEDDIKIGKRFTANIGVHASTYYTDNKWFYSIQPRINASFDITKRLTLTASYADMTQYIHLLTSSGGILARNLWLPATKKTVPEKSRQYTAGLQYLYKKYEFSVEGFYKTLSHLIDFKAGSSFFLIDKTWEEEIEKNGEGKIYGIEFLARKTKGKLTGWVAYTWSKNTRRFDNLNSGIEFAYTYDRRHDLAIVINYRKSKRFSVSASWIFGTGLPVTLGASRLWSFRNTGGSGNEGAGSDYPGNVFLETQIFVKNNYRMPNYHRLDIALNFSKQKKRGKRTWSISVYNAYNQKNAYFMYFRSDREGKMHLYKFTLFPIIPSFGYSFKF